MNIDLLQAIATFFVATGVIASSIGVRRNTRNINRLNRDMSAIRVESMRSARRIRGLEDQRAGEKQ